MTSCSLDGLPLEPVARADAIAAQGGLSPVRYRAGGFDIHGYERATASQGGKMTVYIEGDGRAWRSRRRPAADPTPTDPVALALASADPGRDVLYLARPCQYQRPGDDVGRCDSRIWTSARYGPEVLNAMAAAIDQAKRDTGAARLALVGYSGGAAVAALLAARRTDVVSLVTVAGLLDHAAWTRYHAVSPLTGSLNPADYPAALAKLPQVHFVGGRDDVVPPAITEGFLDRLGRPATARIVRIADADHTCCWARLWPDLAERAARLLP